VLEDEEGVQRTWRLVDKDESDPARGRISIQSPIGRALMGKEVGDEVTIVVPRGTRVVEITNVEYK
jgi:transcription elongation GreA/GreB family factor